METGNQPQIDYWNGEVGQRWAEHRGALDAAFAPLTQALFAASGLAPGDRVLDIGCGAGETTLLAARQVAPSGRVTGADVSEPLLDAARAREAAEPVGAAIEWLKADVQSHAFEARFDHALSRFGVMFFDDSAAAFANIRANLVEGGRLRFLCWRAMAENPWVALPRAAVMPLLPDSEAPSPDAPGPFRFALRETLRPLLEGAGFRDIVFEPVNRTMRVGRTPEEAAGFVVTRGPIARLLRERDPAVQEAALRTVVDLFAKLSGGGPVELGAACWLVSARA
ncbi:class I SAM-dependent methyltransferase [Methylorubrum salsuginis]|uniref:Ubiquinone/menaquinone biosynthesis C-methylase UbiE n=1 Tax=Methylorubrum salsuginis TaxID=414703 RepID=A0A1I4AAT6_9HYPH|nr:methyltransferase domain-containing protein [Methylorubrum salsuginis]SFK53207.1 Ubiquinone/menaquinone biosynthesis C-methylase UbiE [Methylorubrum salsuginis]